MMGSRPARVTVVTSGHLSTCPRMLKSADALSGAGYDVRVIATLHEPWATETDRDVASRRTWKAETIDYRRGESGSTYWWTGARYRAARVAAGLIGPGRIPYAFVSRAFGRVHSELVRAIAADPGDLIYGGTTGALAGIAEAAQRSGTAYGVDLEDFHGGETSGPDAPLVDALATRVERAVMRGAAFVTTSSEAIASAYHERDGIEAAVIHNTFPLPSRPPEVSRVDPARLRAYWFSQTIGPGRGLENAIVAAGRAGFPGELALRGRPHAGYLEVLTKLAALHAPYLELVHLDPAPPDTMVDCARGYDVGLALESMDVRNRQIALSNKALTYILAGLAVAITDTPGQHPLGADLGRGAALVPVDDVDALAAVFARWASDPAELDCAKRTAWAAATRRWHWEHELERGRLLALVREALA
jgi:glycosyltransferase involved in cell wall biosynthesis